MNQDLYDDKCPRWLTTGQIPPATLWAEHFNRSAKKRNVIYTKYLEQRLAVCRAKYGFLNQEQIFGMALRELKVPTCGFKINQNFLNSHKKNKQQSKGNLKSKSFQSRSYCLFEDAETSSDAVTVDNFHYQHQIFGAPSPPTSFLQNDDIFSDLSEMFEEVQIQPFKSLLRKTRPSDISATTKRKHIKSPKDNRLLNQFEKFKEMANCDSEISSYYETRRENPEVRKTPTPVIKVSKSAVPEVNVISKSKAPAVNIVNKSAVPVVKVPVVNKIAVPVVNKSAVPVVKVPIANQSAVPVPVLNIVNKSILKSNASRENISKTSNFEKSVQFNENLEEVHEYQVFEDSYDDEVSTIEYNSPNDSSLNVSAQEVSKTMSDSILNDSSSIMDIETREIIASTPLPVEEEQVKHNQTEQQLQIIENQRPENSFTYGSPSDTSTQSVENETIEEATICESLFETSQTEECEPELSLSQNSLDESIIYNSFEDSNRTTTNIPLKKNSNEKLKNESREMISIQENDISHNSLQSNTIYYEQDIEVMKQHSPVQVLDEGEVHESQKNLSGETILIQENDISPNSLKSNTISYEQDIEVIEHQSPVQVLGEKEVQGSQLSDDSYIEHSLDNSVESDGNEGIEESNVIFNFIDLNEQDRRDINLRLRPASQFFDFEGGIQNEETLIKNDKDDRDISTTNQNNLSNDLDQRVENAERAEDYLNNELGNGEVEASSKVVSQINEQIRCNLEEKQKCTISPHLSNTSPETKVTVCRADSIQNEKFSMEKERVDLDIVNESNLTNNFEDIEMHNNMGVTTAAIQIEEEVYGEYDEIESLCLSDKKNKKRERVNFDSVRIPISIADEDVALFEEMEQPEVEVEKEQVDLSTTDKNNLSKILEDTEIGLHDNMRFPTAATPIEEDIKGDERNEKVEKLRKEMYFDSVRVPIRPVDEIGDVPLFEETPEMEQLFEEIEREEGSNLSSKSLINKNEIEQRYHYESEKIPISPANKFIESSNLYQECNVSYFQSKPIAFVEEVGQSKKLNSKQLCYQQSSTIPIPPQKRGHSERRMEIPKGKDLISYFESNRILLQNRNEKDNLSEDTHISSQLLELENQPMNEHFDLNSNSSSEFSGQPATGKKFAKKRNFSSIFGNSFRNIGKYLGSGNSFKNYDIDAGSPSSEELQNTNYDLSLDEMNCDDEILIDKSSSFNIPSLEDGDLLIKSDDSLNEFCKALRKPESKIGAGIKNHSQLKSDDESLASSLALTNPKRRRRNVERASNVLNPTTKENLVTSQTTSVTDDSSKSIAEMRKIICTDWIAQNNFFKANSNNWLATSNIPSTEFRLRIPDDTNRVLPMDDGGEENFHQLPDFEFSSSEY
ncbi:hypothetical protein LSTR_LSTR001841 [Laodelphax striatellus]|uniref:Uncharacterized protein n=1 Tax=Laodelphax striatellus TaxID=195883 RepID=A0A482WFW4_LAOST|nr:hypothetical protein LSTR_LSTR001841 [Laodelphax striatellus]